MNTQYIEYVPIDPNASSDDNTASSMSSLEDSTHGSLEMSSLQRPGTDLGRFGSVNGRDESVS